MMTGVSRVMPTAQGLRLSEAWAAAGLCEQFGHLRTESFGGRRLA